MNELVFIENKKAVTTSLKIAEIFGKNHKDLLRKIKEKESIFTERNFAPSEYEDSTGRKLPMYYLDRDFTTYLIMGFTGVKADKWKLKYIEAFNKMEEVIHKPLSALEQIKLTQQAAIEVSEKLETVNKDLQEFKKTLPLFGLDCDRITSAVKARGTHFLGGHGSNAYSDKSLRQRVYSDIHREVKRQFGVSTYKAIRRNQCDRAVMFVNAYEIPFVMQNEIKDVNAQRKLSCL